MLQLRLKGRQIQGECSTILILSFMILLIGVLSVNMLPAVYISLKSNITEADNESIISFAVSVFALLIADIFYWGLSLGIDRFMLKRAENVVSGAGDIFYYIAPKRVLGMSIFMLRLTLTKISVILLLLVPAIVCGYIFGSISLAGFSAAVCCAFGAFTIIFVLLALKTYGDICDSFFLVRYRYINGTGLNFGNMISQSQYDMSSKAHNLKKLRRSFVGWFALCVLILPIPYVWSYYRQTKACFAAEIIDL